MDFLCYLAEPFTNCLGIDVMLKRKSIILLVGLAFLCMTCQLQAAMNPKDPIEPFNRAMFSFNDFLDRLILKPVATVYNQIVPKPLAKGISNMFSNVDLIPTIINDLLQLNIYQAASDSWRFGINSTVGLLGFFDVACQIGLEPNSEDLGLTLAHWGYTRSTYIVLPFLGPTTFRDAIAWPVNYQYMTIYPYIQPTSVRYRIFALGLIVKRADLLRFESVMQQAAIDKYVFVRDAYMQRRNYLIERNRQLGDPYIQKYKLEECAAPADTTAS